jgi:NAD(P)-dependent dehydrogenase (short-subunit alcohol dehydrogenase family)
MIIDLSGKNAVVSGSTSGIGFAIAQGLAAAGAAVVLNGRSQKSVDTALSRLAATAPHAKVDGIAADLSVAEGVATLVARARETDILVNNLGIFEPKPFDAITDADWSRFFETNVMSGVRLSRHYLPAMVRRGWGRVVFISSESGLNIPVEMIHYGMTKTAQLAIARGLAESVAGTGVTVNAVLPGPTRSDGVADFFARLAKQQGLSQQDMERDFIAHPAPGERRGSRQYGGVRLLAASLGHHRGCVAGRRRRRALDRVRPALEHDPENWDPVFGKDHAPTIS